MLGRAPDGGDWAGRYDREVRRLPTRATGDPAMFWLRRLFDSSRQAEGVTLIDDYPPLAVFAQLSDSRRSRHHDRLIIATAGNLDTSLAGYPPTTFDLEIHRDPSAGQGTTCQAKGCVALQLDAGGDFPSFAERDLDLAAYHSIQPFGTESLYSGMMAYHARLMATNTHQEWDPVVGSLGFDLFRRLAPVHNVSPEIVRRVEAARHIGPAAVVAP
jgi:hypothetical protein